MGGTDSRESRNSLPFLSQQGYRKCHRGTRNRAAVLIGLSSLSHRGFTSAAVFSIPSIRKPAQPRPGATHTRCTMTLVVLLGAAAVVAVGGYARSRVRAGRSRASHSWRCPRCDKKYRYPARLAGRLLPCPACKRPVTLPLVPQQRSRTAGQLSGYILRRKSHVAVCRPAC